MTKALLTPELLQSLAIVDWAYTTKTTAQSFEQFKSAQKNLPPELAYLTGERGEMRADLKLWHDDIQSALVFLFDYSQSFQELQQWYATNKPQAKMASYVLAYEGVDYHLILRQRLNQLGELLQQSYQHLRYYPALDTHPVLERDLAWRAGLGWIGKNSMHIHRKHGSTHLIGILALNCELPILERTTDSDHCGTCTACLDACPTQAIDTTHRTLIYDRCISTFTIETFKDGPAPLGMSTSGGDIFGCDICQEVCPWNSTEDLNPMQGLHPVDNNVGQFFLTRTLQEVLKELESMSNGEYRRRFKQTPLERTGRLGMIKNIKVQLQQSKRP